MTLGWLLGGKSQKKIKSNVNINGSRDEKTQHKAIENYSLKLKYINSLCFSFKGLITHFR